MKLCNSPFERTLAFEIEKDFPREIITRDDTIARWNCHDFSRYCLGYENYQLRRTLCALFLSCLILLNYILFAKKDKNMSVAIAIKKAREKSNHIRSNEYRKRDDTITTRARAR